MGLVAYVGVYLMIVSIVFVKLYNISLCVITLDLTLGGLVFGYLLVVGEGRC